MANLITENSSFREVINAIIEDGTDSLPKILEIFYNTAMAAERTTYMNAQPYARNEER